MKNVAKPTMRAMTRYAAILGLTLFLTSPVMAAAPAVSGGSVTAAPGRDVEFPVTLHPGSKEVASLQFRVRPPKGWSMTAFAAGPAAQAANKSVTGKKESGRVLLFGLNQTVIADGVVATIKLRVPAGAPAGSQRIVLDESVFSDPRGVSLKAGPSTNGTVLVQNP